MHLRLPNADLRSEERRTSFSIANRQSGKSQIANNLLPLDFMQRVAAEARAVLLDLDFLGATGDLDFGAVVQVARFGALKPHHFSAFFCHDEYL